MTIFLDSLAEKNISYVNFFRPYLNVLLVKNGQKLFHFEPLLFNNVDVGSCFFQFEMDPKASQCPPVVHDGPRRSKSVQNTEKEELRKMAKNQKKCSNGDCVPWTDVDRRGPLWTIVGHCGLLWSIVGHLKL